MSSPDKKNVVSDHILEKYSSAPSHSGVYLMKSARGKIIYVGKALNLKKRLASYFVRGSGHDLKTALLLQNITDFDVIVTSTEHEALILESNLIKKHNPKYNIILKDGKNYPCFRMDIRQEYPVLQVVRSIKKDGASYFGPFSSSHGVKKISKEVNRIFKLRKCRDSHFRNRSRPCLQYQMKACLGPCCHDVPVEEYGKIVKDVILFLKGRKPELIERLRSEMKAEADAMNFEKAAYIRDTLAAIEKSLERQIAVTADMMDRDVVACTGKGGLAVVTVVFVRSGYVVGTGNHVFEMKLDTTREITGAFLKQYYLGKNFIPPEIVVAEPFEDQALLQERFSMERGKKVNILVPERGEKRQLVEMALSNARSEIGSRLSRERESADTLAMLQALLGIPSLPRRIECFDNSNMAGSDPVSSMAVFIDGEPDKSSYRKYIIKNVKIQDDYAYMGEVLTRRFSDKEGTVGCGTLPDLLVVDGGRGQLSVAVSVLTDLGLQDSVPVVGLAKRDVPRGETHDKIYLPGRSNPLNTSHALKALYLLQRIRDEAHDCAVSFQRRRRIQRGKKSILDGITGIGKKRKTILLGHFKGISAMKRAGIQELAALPGMTKSAARALYDALRDHK
ncbi:MAG: excinuclease ABC subunit UvrC [Desulfamplus sp.]|nr:excinuclease ABC subunit UvrC [Desulfamplus sp.]